MISFSTIEIKFVLQNKLEVKNWVKSVLDQEGRKAGDLTYIFCSDEYLGIINKKYLKHNTLTDIITFDYSEGGKLSGDILISIERVKENAATFKISFEKELGRVMVHGILHLVGYKDKTKVDKEQMRKKEDFYLVSFPIL